MPTKKAVTHLVITIIFAGLAVAGVAARFASRRMKKMRLQLEDYLLLVGLVLCLGECGLTVSSTWNNVLGEHIANLTVEEIDTFNKSVFASCIVLPTCLAITKISLLVLYHKIFSVTSFRIINYTLMGIITVWYITLIFTTVFLCTPVRAQFDHSVEGKCGSVTKMNVSTPVPWVVTDFVVLLAPIPYIMRLNMAQAQRLALVALFGLGGLTCIVSTVRYGTFWMVKDDPTYDMYIGVIFTTIEPTITVLCVSLIASKPALEACLSERFKSRIQIYLLSRSQRRSNTPRGSDGEFKEEGRADSAHTSENSRTDSEFITVRDMA